MTDHEFDIVIEHSGTRYDTIRYIICTEKLTGKLPV